MSKKKIPPLLIEHLDDSSNLHLFAVIEYHRNEYVCIIDDITCSEIKAFVVDYHFEEGLSKSDLISQAILWLYSSSNKHQLSVELASKGLTPFIGPMYRNFELNGVSRVVGKVFQFPEFVKPKIKRKRVITIPEGIEIKFKKF